MLLWLLIAGWAIVTTMAFTVPGFAAHAGTAQLMLMFIFAWLHGTARYGNKAMALFAVAVIVVVNIFETARDYIDNVLATKPDELIAADEPVESDEEDQDAAVLSE